MEKISKMTKISEKEKKPEKSLEDRFLGMKSTTRDSMEEYKQALQAGTFEDQESEKEGSGEKRKEILQAKMNTLFDRAEKMKAKLDSKEKLPNETELISAIYSHPDMTVEGISFSIEEELEKSIILYKKTNLELPPNFEDQIKEIWENNIYEIQKTIEENGFDEILFIPGNISLTELNNKMTDVYNETWEDSDFKSGGSFAGAKSSNVDKTRIVFAHKTQNLKDRPELEKTLNIQGKDVKMDQTLTLEDYLIFQRKYFEETGKHLDEDGWTWLATESGARLVNVNWNPSDGQVNVNANDLDYQNENLGSRPSRRSLIISIACFLCTLSNLGSFSLFLVICFQFQDRFYLLLFYSSKKF
jgi:hypothetical protein